MEYCKLNNNERIEKTVVTKTWRINSKTYANRESSILYDFSNGDDIRIIETLCKDTTGISNYFLVRITRNTEEECVKEFWGQFYDGLLENETYIKEKNVEEVEV